MATATLAWNSQASQCPRARKPLCHTDLVARAESIREVPPAPPGALRIGSEGDHAQCTANPSCEICAASVSAAPGKTNCEIHACCREGADGLHLRICTVILTQTWSSRLTLGGQLCEKAAVRLPTPIEILEVERRHPQSSHSPSSLRQQLSSLKSAADFPKANI